MNPGIAVNVMAILTGVGLVANLICGKLVTRECELKFLGVGLILLAGGLAAFPLIDGPRGANVYAVAIGLSGGVISIIFFAAWGHLFGRAELGRIQAAAQFATVLASATGPMLMAESFARAGSYSVMFYALAVVATCIAIAAFVTRTPRSTRLKP